MKINLGHATIEQWADPDFFWPNLGLGKKGHLPITIGINCGSGFFDGETAKDNLDPTGIPDPFPSSIPKDYDKTKRYLGESLVFDPGGSLAHIGSTRDSGTASNDRLIREFGNVFLKTFQESNSLALGELLTNAVNQMRPTLSVPFNSTFRALILTYNLLGDPTLDISLSPPFQLDGNLHINRTAEKTLRLRFAMKNSCEACNPNLDKRPIFLVMRDKVGNILSRGVASSSVSDTSFAREIILSAPERGEVSYTLSGPGFQTVRGTLNLEQIPMNEIRQR
jgi:hypothetical protein